MQYIRHKKYMSVSKMRGMSLVELIIYMSMLVILLGAITQSTLMLTTHYRAVRNTRDIEDSAIVAMDRLTRTARGATDILPKSLASFATTTFVTTDPATGLSTTTSFYIVQDKLRMSENGVDLGPLTKESVRVTGFDIIPIQTTNSKAIRISISLLSDEATPAVISKNFYSTVVLRGSYQ